VQLRVLGLVATLPPERPARTHPATRTTPHTHTHPGADPDLSTIIVGPWLSLWPTTHENKHTRAWAAFQQQQQQQQALAQ
jgi:hypothetical protein